MRTTYYLCDLRTGLVLTELPLGGGAFTSVIAREDTHTFTLDTADPSCPDDWAALLVLGPTMIVLCIDDQPAMGWAVTDRTMGSHTVPITATTLECCLESANVPDLEATLDEAQTAAILCAVATARFGFLVEHTPTGRVSDASYSTLEDRSVLAALNDLMAADGGPEWRIFLRWADPATKQSIEKVIEIRPRIGIPRPDAVFDLDADGHGSIETYTRAESYAKGKGATMLIGTSEGSGQSRPMTDPIVSPLVPLGWPLWEARVNFNGLDRQGVTDEDAELQRRARAELGRREYGSTAWTIVGTADAPVPGLDYSHGDTISIQVAPQGKRDPIGGTAQMRVLGWTLDPISGRATLIAWDPKEA